MARRFGPGNIWVGRQEAKGGGAGGDAHDEPLVEDGLAERAAPELLDLDKLAVVGECVHPCEALTGQHSRMGCGPQRRPSIAGLCVYCTLRTERGRKRTRRRRRGLVVPNFLGLRSVPSWSLIILFLKY